MYLPKLNEVLSIRQSKFIISIHFHNKPLKGLDISKNVYFQLFDPQNTFFNNLNPTSLKMFYNHDKIHRSETKFHKNPEDK